VATGPGVRGLFADWRAATGRTSDAPVDEAELDAFFAEVPGAASTLARRRRILEVAGLAPPRKPPPAAPGRAADLDAALRVIPVGGWPDGLVGRRDAALLVAARVAGLRRPQMRALVVGGPLPDLPVVDARPSVCPACALSRWVRTLLVAGDIGWGEVRSQLAELPAAPASDTDGHDCVRTMPTCRSPIRSVPLLSGIDRYGWVDESRPLSARAISAIVGARLAAAGNAPALDNIPEEQAGMPRPGRSPSWQETIRLRRDAARRLDEIDAMLEKIGVD